MAEFAAWTYEAMTAMLRLVVAAVAGLFAIGILLLIVVAVVCTVQELRKRGKKHE